MSTGRSWDVRAADGSERERTGSERVGANGQRTGRAANGSAANGSAANGSAANGSERVGSERVSLTEAVGEIHQHVGALPHIGEFCPFANTVCSEYPEMHLVISRKWLITLPSRGLTISASSFPLVIALSISACCNRTWHARKPAWPFGDDAFVESLESRFQRRWRCWGFEQPVA
jgi:hypothetical protein